MHFTMTIDNEADPMTLIRSESEIGYIEFLFPIFQLDFTYRTSTLIVFVYSTLNKSNIFMYLKLLSDYCIHVTLLHFLLTYSNIHIIMQ